MKQFIRLSLIELMWLIDVGWDFSTHFQCEAVKPGLLVCMVVMLLVMGSGLIKVSAVGAFPSP